MNVIAKPRILRGVFALFAAAVVLCITAPAPAQAQDFHIQGMQLRIVELECQH